MYYTGAMTIDDLKVFPVWMSVDPTVSRDPQEATTSFDRLNETIYFTNHENKIAFSQC